jgi:hypothetical protein
MMKANVGSVEPNKLKPEWKVTDESASVHVGRFDPVAECRKGSEAAFTESTETR